MRVWKQPGPQCGPQGPRPPPDRHCATGGAPPTLARGPRWRGALAGEAHALAGEPPPRWRGPRPRQRGSLASEGQGPRWRSSSPARPQPSLARMSTPARPPPSSAREGTFPNGSAGAGSREASELPRNDVGSVARRPGVAGSGRRGRGAEVARRSRARARVGAVCGSFIEGVGFPSTFYSYRRNEARGCVAPLL